MPISQRRAPERSLIGWLNGVPPTDVGKLFQQRGFELVQYPPAVEFDGQAILDGIRATILVQQDNLSNSAFADAIEKNAKAFLDMGCAFIVCPLTKGRRTALQTLSSLHLPTAGFDRSEAKLFRPQDGDECPVPHVHLFSSNVLWHEIANFVSSYDPGLRVNRQLVPTGASFTGEQLMLIQRAFSDCKSVHFAPMSEKGRSGVDVYQAHADLLEGHLGPWPQPYFVKVGDRDKIYREYVNYQTSVHPYLPYHLAPRLVNERCCLAAKSGIIVGDFVDESEGLLDCTEHARGAAPLSYLFDQTLQGWYRNAEVGNEPFGKVLRRMFRGSILQPRLDRAFELGASMPLSDLLDVISNIASADVLMGPTHGDLHAGNIRVRKSEAILIDFFAQRERAPLLVDLAALEVSLLVDGFEDDPRLAGDASLYTMWLESIKPLYDGDPLRADMNACHPKDHSHWFYTSVRIVRRHARAMEHGRLQYAAALVIALLRKASKDNDAVEPGATRRATAYLLAEQLARGIRVEREESA